MCMSIGCPAFYLIISVELYNLHYSVVPVAQYTDPLSTILWSMLCAQFGHNVV